MNYVANDLIEKSELRNKLIDRVNVLNKVKELFLIPKLEIMSTKMVADFYEVETDIIKQTYLRNKDELDQDGVSKIGGKDFRRFHLEASNVPFQMIKGNVRNGHATYLIEGHKISINNNGSYFFPPRAVLRVGMLLRDSEVAKEVRTQLLNTFECATEEQRTEAIDEEGKLLLDIIRAESDDLVAVGLKKYRDYMNRHIAKIESEKAELEVKNNGLQTELNIVHNQITTWTPNQITRRLIMSVASRMGGKPEYAWGKLRSNLFFHHGISLEARKGNSKKSFISFVREDEWEKVLQEVYALAKDYNVDIQRCIGGKNAKRLEEYAHA